MEGGLAQSCVPSTTSMDKSIIFDVKPLRNLAPVIPSIPQAPPFAWSPMTGTFPSGFCPFYPFSMAQESQNSHGSCEQTPPVVGVSREYDTFPDNGRPPGATYAAPSHVSKGLNRNQGFSMEASREMVIPPDGCLNSNGDVLYDGQKQENPHRRDPNVLRRKKKAKIQDVVSPLSADGGGGSSENFIRGLSSSQRADGDRGSVDFVLTTFDALRRRLSQLEDAKVVGDSRRIHLKCGTILMSRGIRTNARKRIGPVPGIEIGDIFFFRMELCLVGIHSQTMAGIDYLSVGNALEEEPVAVSIVSSGGYDNDVEKRDVLIYSGQGGNINKKDKQVGDQKLQRGNLALEKSLKRGNDIRVIRGMKDAVNPLAKVYIYDGLYTVKEFWREKGKSGCDIFKYKLVRKPGQPGAYAIWETIQKWREGYTFRAGLILPDLSAGAETMPASLVNDVDDEKAPGHFTYFPTLKYSKSFTLTQPSFGCSCHNACHPGNLDCSCIRKNGGDIPYTTNGILVSRKPLVHECGPTCPCFPDCKNRVSQTGLRVHLEVFKTNDRGWGLRTLDPIRAGTFICEFAGEVVDKARAKRGGDVGENDEYIFDTSRTYAHSSRWNYDPDLLKDESSENCSEDFKIPSPLIISAKNVGNVSRFLNHSCSPNVFWQPILYEHNSASFLHIAFFAIKHIPPLTELTYDYGIDEFEKCDVEASNALPGKKKCLCGSSNCRGYY